jgi:hypothetical protein
VDANGPASYYAATAQDYFNRKLERSVTEFNYPQTFKLSWTYDLPVGKGKAVNLGWANYLAGGWTLAAIHNYQSGSPVAVFQSGVNTPPGFGRIRPDVLSNKLTIGGAPGRLDFFDGSPYLNTAAFSISPITPNGTPLRVGTAPRFLSNVRGPHSMSERVRLAKRFPLTRAEGRFLQLGITWDNPMNRTGRSLLDATVGDAAFGQVAANGGGKILQLDLRAEF